MISENKLPCLFCKWIESGYEDVIKENRLLNNPDEDGYLVVLDRDPKVTGHTLIISKKTKPHYSDITELKNDVENDNEMRIFRGVVEWAHKIKDEINKKVDKDFDEGEEGEEKVKKVYILSMCDHWTKKELRERWQDATEHLHFHLVPRYDFDENIRGEEVLIRGVELKSEELKLKKLKAKEQRKIEEMYNLLNERKDR